MKVEGEIGWGEVVQFGLDEGQRSARGNLIPLI